VKFTLSLSSGYGYGPKECTLAEMQALGTALSAIAIDLRAADKHAANVQTTIGPFQVQITIIQESQPIVLPPPSSL
jgi:hypothetical protein